MQLGTGNIILNITRVMMVCRTTLLRALSRTISDFCGSERKTGSVVLTVRILLFLKTQVSRAA